MRKLAEAASWMVHYFGLPALIASAASAPPAARAPFNHLVGKREQRWGHGAAESSCGFQIEDELEP